jgi:hypothetical protein
MKANAASVLLPSDQRAAEAKAAAELKAREEAMAALLEEQRNAERVRVQFCFMRGLGIPSRNELF